MSQVDGVWRGGVESNGRGCEGRVGVRLRRKRDVGERRERVRPIVSRGDSVPKSNRPHIWSEDNNRSRLRK